MKDEGGIVVGFVIGALLIADHWWSVAFPVAVGVAIVGLSSVQAWRVIAVKRQQRRIELLTKGLIRDAVGQVVADALKRGHVPTATFTATGELQGEPTLCGPAYLRKGH